MSSAAIATVIRIMESVPEPAQNWIAEHLGNYLEELQEEMEWDSLVSQPQTQLIKATRRAKEEIRAGQA